MILGEGVFARRSAPESEPVVVPEVAQIPLAPVAQVPDDDGALTAAIDRLSTMLVTAPTPDVQVIAPSLDVDRLSASLVAALSPLLQRDDTPLVSTLSALADKLEKVSRKVSGGGGGGGGPTRLLGPDGNYYSATSPLPVSVQGAQASSVTVSNFPATQPVSGSVAVSNFPATQPVSGTVSVANVPQNGVWSYAGGTSGTRAVAGRVLDINAHSTSGGTLVINGGDTIPIPANTAFTFTPNGNLTSPTLIFTNTDSYAVEIVS